MSTQQAALPFDVPVSIVEREFLDWIDTEEGREVEAEIMVLIERLRERGKTHYSIDGLFHVVRYHRDLEKGGDSEYKLNNNHRSFMARHLMEKHPSLKGFFELRVLRGRAWRRSDNTRARPA